MTHRHRTKSTCHRKKRTTKQILDNPPEKHYVRLFSIFLKSLWLLLLVMVNGIPSMADLTKNLSELLKLIFRIK